MVRTKTTKELKIEEIEKNIKLYEHEISRYELEIINSDKMIASLEETIVRYRTMLAEVRNEPD